jgi:predicted HicB family RNase H-like nuclease
MILQHDEYLVEASREEGDALCHGVVANAQATLHFAGRDVSELRQAFAETIADYRDWRRERRAEGAPGRER